MALQHPDGGSKWLLDVKARGIASAEIFKFARTGITDSPCLRNTRPTFFAQLSLPFEICTPSGQHTFRIAGIDSRKSLIKLGDNLLSHFVQLFLPLFLNGLACIPLAIASMRPSRKEQWSFLRMALAIYFVSMFLLTLSLAVPALHVGHMNWSGKLLSILVTYLLIFSTKAASPARQYLTFRQKSGSLPRSVFLTAIILLTSLAIIIATGGVHSPSLETVLFEATVPGIDEETVYRAGIMGCVIAASESANCRSLKTTIFAVILTSILFGVIHAFTYTNAGHFAFDLEAFGITATIGALLAILTVSSGSIVVPVLAHNAANCLNFLF